jgi:hypothetical protein
VDLIAIVWPAEIDRKKVRVVEIQRRVEELPGRHYQGFRASLPWAIYPRFGDLKPRQRSAEYSFVDEKVRILHVIAP